MPSDVPFTPLYINGEFRPASNGAAFSFSNAFHGRVVGNAASASSQDCKDAVEAAAKAFATWEHSPVAQRMDIIYKASQLLESPQYSEKVRQAVRDETSAHEEMHFFNVNFPAMIMRLASGLVHFLRGESYPSSIPGSYTIMQRRAKGVILAITPWNCPTLLSLRAVVISVLCGNTMILKCSEVSPRSQAVVAEIFHDAGLPRGVLNFISMNKKDAPRLTAEIIAHPAVRLITFTGSAHVAKSIAEEAARHLKPCIIELGGKCPAIVLDDADIEMAAKAIALAVLMHSGQVCISTARLIVSRSVSEKVISAVVDIMRKFKAGDPHNDPEVKLSALYSEEHAIRVMRIVTDAVNGGAKVLLGDLGRKGAVVQPHVLSEVKPGMELWEKEIFAPILYVSVVDTVDEAIELANATNYTLGATLWTKDLNTALSVISRVRAGLMVINGQQIFQDTFRIMEGLGGLSGYGGFDVEHFTDRRIVTIFPSGNMPLPLVG